jgi:hypothetical protein
MKLRLDILPPPQRELWDKHGKTIPAGWVLYGGTAVALRLGLTLASAAVDPAAIRPMRLLSPHLSKRPPAAGPVSAPLSRGRGGPPGAPGGRGKKHASRKRSS